MRGASRPPWLGFREQQWRSLAHFMKEKTGEKKRLEYRRVVGRSWGRWPGGGGCGGGGGGGLGGGVEMAGMRGKGVI